MMYKTIFQLIWPYLQNYLTKQATEQAAAYLQKRREQRLGQSDVVDEVIAQEQHTIYLPTPDDFSTANAVWYILSGILLGGALSLILTKIFQQED